MHRYSAPLLLIALIYAFPAASQSSDEERLFSAWSDARGDWQDCLQRAGDAVPRDANVDMAVANVEAGCAREGQVAAANGAAWVAFYSDQNRERARDRVERMRREVVAGTRRHILLLRGICQEQPVIYCSGR